MKTKTLLTVMVSLFALNAHAGREGHGGDALIRNGKLYLLDLVEAGVEEAPYFNDAIKPGEYFLETVQKTFKSQPVQFQNRLAQKLTEISKISDLMASAITEAIKLYSFRFVATDLIDVPDEDSSLSYDSNALVQIAIRREMIIMIARARWNLLPVDQQVALITHEIVYAFATPEGSDHQQLSAPARELNGAFYMETPYLYNDGGQSLGLIASGHSELYNMLGAAHFVLKRPVRVDLYNVGLGVRYIELSNDCARYGHPSWEGSVYSIDATDPVPANKNEKILEMLSQFTDPNYQCFKVGKQFYYTPYYLRLNISSNGLKLINDHGLSGQSFVVGDLHPDANGSYNTHENLAKILTAHRYE